MFNWQGRPRDVVQLQAKVTTLIAVNKIHKTQNLGDGDTHWSWSKVSLYSELQSSITGWSRKWCHMYTKPQFNCMIFTPTEKNNQVRREKSFVKCRTGADNLQRRPNNAKCVAFWDYFFMHSNFSPHHTLPFYHTISLSLSLNSHFILFPKKVNKKLSCRRQNAFSIITRGQSNLTKSASRGWGHSPVRGHPRGRNLYHWIPGVGVPISVP